VNALETEVAGLQQAQAAHTTEQAQQAAEITRLSGFVSYLATVVPRRTPVLTPPTKTPYVAIEGGVLLEEGRCCAGGAAGVPLTLQADLEARSQTGQVTEMRLYVGLGPASLRDMADQPWEPYRPQVGFEVTPAVNWVGYYVSAQFKDAQGGVSDIFWDDISVEGMPSELTPSP
jgi:hypothetical protein